MRPDISEFSYGYALTDELIHRYRAKLTAAPVFPSLYREGKTGGGYDVMLRCPGLPLFLQFKLSDCMLRDNAMEVRTDGLATPFYRMHIRPVRHSQQHQMLLDLERAGNCVYYSAPAFHTPDELNDAYFSHQVCERSLWLRPTVIGDLPDDGRHHVAFQIRGRTLFCSEPRPLDTEGSFEEFTRWVEASYDRGGTEALSDRALSELANTIVGVAMKGRDGIPHRLEQISRRFEREGIHPLNRIALYSHLFLDCRLFIVNEKTGPE